MICSLSMSCTVYTDFRLPQIFSRQRQLAHVKMIFAKFEIKTNVHILQGRHLCEGKTEVISGIGKIASCVCVLFAT